jgi:hypothetical protein
VCLRCRHAVRAAAREQFNRALLRAGAVAVVVATFLAAGAVGASAIRSRIEGRNQASAPDSQTGSGTLALGDSIGNQVTGAPTVIPQSMQVARRAAAHTVAPPARTPATRQADRASPTLTPVVPDGLSDLVSGVTAVRRDTDVVVAFDTPEARTRRPEKFEQFVRTTLPLVYGPAVQNVLDRIPDGTIVGQGELLTELPKRGVRIPLDGEWTIRLFPETRPGQDGPLVIRYRVSVVPTSE